MEKDESSLRSAYSQNNATGTRIILHLSDRGGLFTEPEDIDRSLESLPASSSAGLR